MALPIEDSFYPTGYSSPTKVESAPPPTMPSSSLGPIGSTKSTPVQDFSIITPEQLFSSVPATPPPPLGLPPLSSYVPISGGSPSGSTVSTKTTPVVSFPQTSPQDLLKSVPPTPMPVYTPVSTPKPSTPSITGRLYMPTELSVAATGPLMPPVPTLGFESLLGAPMTRVIAESNIPYPSGPQCPPGERLYKVSRGGEVQYVYAKSEAEAAKELGYEAGYSAFVTVVQSPEAYPGGKYPNERVVTTSSGEQVRVPWSPEKEAKKEFSSLFGNYPTRATLTEDMEKVLTNIREGMVAGTYVSPKEAFFATPYIQKWMQATPGLSPNYWWTTARETAGGVLATATKPGTCGWHGMTAEGAQIAIAFYQSRNAPGDVNKVNTIKEAYATHYTPSTFLKRAELVDYDVFGDIESFREGEYYNLGAAIAAQPEANRAAFATKLERWFPKDIVGQAVVQANILGISGSAPITVETLGTALSTGRITEPDLRRIYGDSIANQVVQSAGVGLGAGIGTVGFGFVGLPGKMGMPLSLNWTQAAKQTISGPTYREPAAKGFWQKVIAPSSFLGQKIWGPSVPYSMTEEGQAKLKVDYEAYKALPAWQRFLGLDYQFGGPMYDKDTGKYLPPPVGGFGPDIFTMGKTIPQVIQPLLQFRKWSQIPIQIGRTSKLGEMVPGVVRLTQQAFSKALTTGKQLLYPTITTTAFGLKYGGGVLPVPADVKAKQIYGTLTSDTKASMKADYLRQAGSEYDKAVSNLGEGQEIPISRDEFLAQAGSEFESRLQQGISEQVAGRMEYQPGLKGYVGRAGEFLRQPVYSLSSLPGPSLPKAFISGMYQLAAPLTVATELFPTKGPRAFTTMIPYYGPVTAAGALQWRESGFWGRLGTVAFTALPFGLGALSYWRAPKITPREMQLRELGMGPRFKIPRVGFEISEAVGPSVTAEPGRLVPQLAGSAYMLQGGGTFAGGTIGPGRLTTESAMPLVESLPKVLVEKIMNGKILTPQEELLALRYVAGKIVSRQRLGDLEVQIHRNNPRGVEFFLRQFQTPPTVTRVVGGLTARPIAPKEAAFGGRVSLPMSVQNLLGRIRSAWGLKDVRRPASELSPMRKEALGYKASELTVPPESRTPTSLVWNEVKSVWEHAPQKVGFFLGKEILSEAPYRMVRYQWPFEGPKPYIGGTVPQWMQSWASWGGLPPGLTGGWGRGPQLGGRGGGGIGTQTRVGGGTVTGTITGTPRATARPGLRPLLSLSTLLGGLPLAVAVAEPVTVTTPIPEVVASGVPSTLTPLTTVVPVATPFAMPFLAPVPSPVPTPIPVVTIPVPTPIPTPTPPPPETEWKTPWPWPPIPGFGHWGGGPAPHKGLSKRLGIGKWAFTGFEVSGPHPLVPETVGYTWMGGEEMPYGVGEKIPQVTIKRSAPTKGLVRMA